MKFSLLMSLYAKEKPHYLSESLKSIENQIVQPSEVVIVKDGPLTEDLEKVLEDFMKKGNLNYKIISLAKNAGLGKALNFGLDACSYNVVARMDTDDVALPERFSQQIGFLKKHKDIDILGSWIAEYDKDLTEKLSDRKPPLRHEDIMCFSKYANPFNHMSVVFKKEKVLEVGGYQPMSGFEDFYLWIRMLKNGAKGANIPKVLIHARAGSEMVGRRHGIAYARQEIDFTIAGRKLGYFSYYDLSRNMIIRVLPRFLPKTFLDILYRFSRTVVGKQK